MARKVDDETSRVTESSEYVQIEENSLEKLAYALWEGRGRPDGSSEADWFAAENELSQAGKNDNS